MYEQSCESQSSKYRCYGLTFLQPKPHIARHLQLETYPWPVASVKFAALPKKIHSQKNNRKMFSMLPVYEIGKGKSNLN